MLKHRLKERLTINAINFQPTVESIGPFCACNNEGEREGDRARALDSERVRGRERDEERKKKDKSSGRDVKSRYSI